MTRNILALLGMLGLLLGACTGSRPGPDQTREGPPPNFQAGDYKIGSPYQVKGVWYYPRVDYNYVETGIASWYGPGFNGKKTANGEIYDQEDLTAAHKTLPLPSMVRVTNLENGRSIELRVNDRGPFKRGRIIDLSRRSARLLGFIGKGTAKVRVEILPAKSRQLAVVAQNRFAAVNAPLAAPTVEVTAVPLNSPGGAAKGSAPVAAFEPAVSALGAPVGSVAGSWLLEAENGQVETLPTAALSPAAGQPAAVPDQTRAASTVGAVPWPDGRVTLEPVAKTSIFVQAGSFLRRDNATRLSARLSVLARSKVTQALVGKKVYFRVRLGPVATVNDADRLLQILSANGISNAQVVVD